MNEQHQQLTLWVGAMRYYLGRQSYAVEDFCKMLINEWTNLDMMTKSIIIRDIEEAFERDDMSRKMNDRYRSLGADIDRVSWERVRKMWTTNYVFEEQQ